MTAYGPKGRAHPIQNGRQFERKTLRNRQSESKSPHVSPAGVGLQAKAGWFHTFDFTCLFFAHFVLHGGLRAGGKMKHQRFPDSNGRQFQSPEIGNESRDM
jgi:hypothetical protein